MYDSPVHYQKDNTWVEIDNTLVKATLTGSPQSGTNTASLAHEFGHLLGCAGDTDDPTSSCFSENCVMAYNVSDELKVENLKSTTEYAYCTDCTSTIWNYIWDYC